MKLRITQLILSGLLLVAVPSLYAQTSSLTNAIEVRGALAIPSGEASFSANGNTGTVISFSCDFDLQNELGFLVRYTHRTENGKHKFLGEFGQTKWNRTNTLSRSFTFLGQTYVRIGPMADMGVVSTRLNLTSTTNNGTRSDSGKITKLAATIGYDLDYDPTSRVNIFNNLGAIAFQGERLFHADGGLKFLQPPTSALAAGYRALRYRVEKNDNFILVRAHGPFLEECSDSETWSISTEAGDDSCPTGFMKFHHR